MWISKKKWKDVSNKLQAANTEIADVNNKLQTANAKITNLKERIKEQDEEYAKLLFLHGEAEPKVEPCMSMACKNCKYAVIEYSYNWYNLRGCGKNRICEHFEKA